MLKGASIWMSAALCVSGAVAFAQNARISDGKLSPELLARKMASLHRHPGDQPESPGPPNDNCATPDTALSGTGGSVTGTTMGATGTDQNSCGDTFDVNDVWFRFTPTTGGNWTIDTCASTSGLDSVLSVHSACPAASNNELLNACNDDSCALLSRVTVTLAAGTPYLIRVAGWNGLEGDFTLTVGPAPTGPPNDLCSAAIPISEGDTAFSNAGAATDGVDHVSCYYGFTSNVNQDIWYNYTPPCSGDVIVSLCAGGTPYDSKLAIYNGCAVCPPPEADLLNCDDDGCAFAGYSVVPGQDPTTVPVTAGNCYRIRVGGFGAATGAGTIQITNSGSPCGTPVTIVSANPPHASANGGLAFRDPLQNTDSALVAQGIGRAGTPSEGAVTYAPISVTFSGTPTPAPTAMNVSMACTGGTCPTVTTVTGSGAGPYLISLSGAIPTLHCTTMTFAGTTPGQKLQYQFLPGDTNLNGTTTGQDVIALVAAINAGTAGQTPQRYDLNRNGSVTGQDVIRIVQLINGGVSVVPQTGYNSASVAACP